MSQMEIMKSCYKFMVILGICAPIDLNKWKMVGGFVRSATILIAMCVCVFYPCSRYFLRHISNLVDATGVALMVSVGFYAAVSLISLTIYQKKILQMMLVLQTNVQKCIFNRSLWVLLVLLKKKTRKKLCDWLNHFPLSIK